MSTSTVVAQVPETPRRKKEVVRVKVKRNPDGQWIINASHNTPSASAVRDQLPPQLKAHTAPYFYNGMPLNHLMQNCTPHIRGKAWSLAIAKAIVLDIQDPPTAEVELVSPTSAYLSVGNRLYRLDCIDQLPTQLKALPAFRRTIMDAAKVEAEALINAGHERKRQLEQQGQILLSDATRNANRVRQELATVQGQLAMYPPTWTRAQGIYLRYPAREHDGTTSIVHVEAAMDIDLRIETVRYNRKTWRHTDGPSLPIRVWTPFDPELTGNNADLLSYRLKVDPSCPEHPHCLWDHSCLDIGDAPKLIDSLTTLNRWKLSVARALSGVNLNSPLRHPPTWDKRILDLLPPPVKDALHTVAARQAWMRVLDSLPTEPTTTGGARFSTADLEASEAEQVAALDGEADEVAITENLEDE